MTPEERVDQPERGEAKNLRGFLDVVEESTARGADYLHDVHPADVAGWLQDLTPEDRFQVFTRLVTEAQAAVLEHADESLREEIVGSLPAGALKDVVEELPADEAVDLLAHADDRVAADVLESLPDEAARELRELATHDPDTAGGVMTTDIVTVALDARIGDAVKEIKKEGEEAEDNLGVFVVDEGGVPVGYLTDRALITHSIHEPVKDVMVEPFLVAADEDQEEAAQIVSKYGLQALAVVGEGGELVGVISAEDAQEILSEEATEDVHRLVGTSPQHQTRLPILRRVVQRLPLMAVTVAGGLASAKILASVVPASSMGPSHEVQAILRYLPLIAGLAGNVGVQSSTILVRAFATGEVERDRDLPVLASEVGAGALIGLICGIATFLFAALLEWTDAPAWHLGASVGSAILAAVTWAAVLGCVVPMSCRRLGIDPAVVAGPFLICLSDISGVSIYIFTAKALLSLS